MKKAVSRRDFMKGAAVVAASAVLAGCDGNAPSSSNSTANPSSKPSNMGDSTSSSSSSSSASSNSSSSSSSDASSASSDSTKDNELHWFVTVANQEGTEIRLQACRYSSGKIPAGAITLPSKFKNADGGYYTVTAIENVGGTYGDLTEITFPDTITEVFWYTFKDCTKLKKVKLSKNLDTMGDFAFSNTGLISIEIPPKLEYVGDEVFSDCKELRTIYLPKTANIWERHFKGCENIKDVYYSGSEKEWNRKFSTDGVFKNATIHFEVIWDALK